jgi:outer membrane protein TolC
MPRTLFAGFALALCLGYLDPAPAQTPPPGPQAAAPTALTFASALQRARQFSQQWLSAGYAAQLAREDSVQARAGLLPSLSSVNQFTYTQPNGTGSGIFVGNDGPHVYTNQAAIHGDIYSPAKRADYHRALAAEAVARARTDVALRGLVAAVAQNYYAVLAAARKLENARQSEREASDFVDLTVKQERGGEVARADVVKAQLQLEQRRIDSRNAEVDLERARIAIGVMIFSDYAQPFTLADDLETVAPMPSLPEILARAGRDNPDLRAGQALIEQQGHEIKATRAELYPTLSFDYFYGINANTFARRNPEGQNQLGSVVQAELTIPLWDWGATRSKVRQSELRLQQARTELTLAQRQLQSNVSAYYAEASASAALIQTLRRSLDLAAESLRLTRLRYEAGEVSALEVADAQTTLAQARNSYSDGLVRYRLAVANIWTLTGVF